MEYTQARSAELPLSETVDRHGHEQGATASRFVVALTLLSAIGGFLFGYDTGVVSGAMLLITERFALSDVQEETLVSITVAMAIVGASFGGPANQRFGRRPAILFSATTFTVGAVLLGTSNTFAALAVGRAVVGVGIGVASLVVPVYIAEAAPSHLRGSLVTLNTLLITFGQFAAGVVDGLFADVDDGWRYMLGLSGVPSVVMMVGFIYLPESPRWLVAAGRKREAVAVLQTLRGTPDVWAEMEEMLASCRHDGLGDGNGGGGGGGAGGPQRGDHSLLDLWRNRPVRRALVLGCGLQALQQLSGINTVMYYSATIYSLAGFSMGSSIWLAAFTSLAQAVGVTLGLYLIERSGRRKLTLTSLALVVVALVSLGLGFYVSDYAGGGGDDDDVPASDYGWVAVASMVSYLFFFGIGMSSIPWVVNAEIYPLHARSLATAASTSVNWLGNVVISATFLSLASAGALNTYGAFWLYASIAAAGWVWLFLCMPETGGLHLEEIEQLFRRPGDPDPDGDPARDRKGSGDGGGHGSVGGGGGGGGDNGEQGGQSLLRGRGPSGFAPLPQGPQGEDDSGAAAVGNGDGDGDGDGQDAGGVALIGAGRNDPPQGVAGGGSFRRAGGADGRVDLL